MRGRGKLFRIKVFLSPCDPLFFQKNRLGALPLRTPLTAEVFQAKALMRFACVRGGGLRIDKAFCFADVPIK